MSKQEIEDNELFTIDEVGDHGIKQEETTTEVKPTKKTKKQKEEEIRSHKTLFVRNVPQTAKDAEFEEFFQKFGPLKTCFLVRKPTDKLCKGFGFVNFSMKEDAEKAIESCKEEEFLGKILKLEWAIKKSIDDKNSAKEKEGIPLKKKSTRGQQKSDLNILDRTVAITNLSNSTGRPQLVNFLEEHGHSAQELQYKGGRGLAIATFETVEIAQIVISSLQNQVLQKNKLEIQFLAQLISKTKFNRLILRNLPFQLSEPELSKLGNGIGAVVECKIQRHSETNKPLGFGFLQFLTNEQSEAAISQLNNKELYGRKITVNWCSGKDFQVREENQHFDIKEEADQDELENYGQNAKMFEDNQSDEALTSDESSSEGEDEDEDDEEENGDDEENEEEKDEEVEGSDNDMDVDDEEEETAKADEPNTTLFVRNILFETTEQDLFDHFTEFGPVKYARIVMDQTGRSRGTGFVKFYKTKDAKKVLDEAKATKDTMPGTAPTTKSVLKPELPQSQSSMLMLQDRLLDVILAVDKEEATKLTAPNKKKDKKNLYLLKEGVVFPKTPEAKGLPEKEITKRLQSHDLRKRQLEKNPSLFISKTRLAIRNMPYDWTDKELRTLAREAVPNFKREAKEGKREDLTKQEKAEGWDQKPKLKQVKVEVDKSQVNATTNKAKSKGFGFVEFEQHSHALAALRYLNCNPDIKGLNKDAKEAKKSQESKGRTNRRLLLVEFSVENKLVLKKRDDRKRKLETIQKNNANNKIAKDAKKDDTPFKKQKRTKPQDGEKPKKRKFFHKGK